MCEHALPRRASEREYDNRLTPTAIESITYLLLLNISQIQYPEPTDVETKRLRGTGCWARQRDGGIRPIVRDQDSSASTSWAGRQWLRNSPSHKHAKPKPDITARHRRVEGLDPSWEGFASAL